MKEIFGDSESQSIFLKCFTPPEHIHKPIILHAAIALRQTNCSSNLYGVNFFSWVSGDHFSLLHPKIDLNF